MKQLVLVRHAKSSWNNTDLADFDRPLSSRGKRDAPEMAERLKLWGLKPDLILSSPAKRARKTAKIVAEVLDYPNQAIGWDSRLYLQGVRSLLAVLAETDSSRDVVLLVGHNPDLTELAERLTGDALDGRQRTEDGGQSFPSSVFRLPSEIPTAGVVSIRLNGESWLDLAETGGVTERFDYPKKREET